MAVQMPFDELNILEVTIDAIKQADPELLKRNRDYYIDEITDFFVLSYVYGSSEAGRQLDAEIMPDVEDIFKALEKPIDGKTYRDRLNEYFDNGTSADINRVLETDMHRIYNTGLWDSAIKAGATQKTWQTMQDPKVRDTHQYLQGVTIPIDAEFYSFRGGKTLYPGQWGIAEEDCSCRCWVEFSK